MDADDVVYSLNYFKEKGVQGYSWPTLKSVTAVDTTTVRIELDKPSGGFIQQLASPDIVPIVPANSADNNGLATVDNGTGPYMISNFVANTSATLKPFPDYSSLTTPATGFGGAKKALISELTFRVIANPATASAAFRTGEVGAIIRPAQQDVKALDAQPNLQVFDVPGTLVVDVDINPNKAPLDNPKLRQAVAYALDRNAIFQAAGQGFGELRDSFSPTKKGATWFGDASIPKWPYEYNVSKAKELVKESGYDGTPIEIIIGPTTYMPPAATVIQQQLKAVGINAELTQLDTTTWLSRNSSLDYGMNVEGQSLFVPPDALYAYYHCDATGKSQKPSSCDQSYNELYEKTASSTDQSARADLFLQLEKKLRETAVVVPFYAQSVLVGVNDKVHGFKINPYEWDNFYNVWVTS
jgi:peptide/nickel transport system substrate-binding protein